ncbi:hypothetical protein GR157_24475 [Burkholderia sp. 4701]|nr:hypothetical protein [Burkholderia sp. 4701]MXN85096.1 hypothetical protein [Burkholderia sp. 4812]
MHEEVNRRLSDIEKVSNGWIRRAADYVLREVCEKDEGRQYADRHEQATNRENGQRAIIIALISALIAVFSTMVMVVLRLAH